MSDEESTPATIITPDLTPTAVAETTKIPVISDVDISSTETTATTVSPEANSYSSIEDILNQSAPKDLSKPAADVVPDIPTSPLFGIEKPKALDSATEVEAVAPPESLLGSVETPKSDIEPEAGIEVPVPETQATPLNSTLADKIADAEKAEQIAHAELLRLNSIEKEVQEIDTEIQKLSEEKKAAEANKAELAKKKQDANTKGQEIDTEIQKLSEEKKAVETNEAELATQNEAADVKIQDLTDKTESLVTKKQALLQDGNPQVEATIPKPAISIPVNVSEEPELSSTEPEIVSLPATDEIVQATASIGPKNFVETEQNISEVDPEAVITWSSKAYLELSKIWKEKFGIEIPRISEMGNILSASYKIINKLETDLPSSKDRIGVVLIPPSSLILDANGQIKPEIKTATEVSVPDKEWAASNSSMAEQKLWNVIVTIKDDEMNAEDSKLSIMAMDDHKISPYEVLVMKDLLDINASPETPVFFIAELTKK